MPRIVRCGVIQAACEWSPEKYSLVEIKEKMIAKHEKMIAAAAKKGVQVLGLQELFYGPYFCAEQNARWYELTESVPNGPTLARMQKLARKYKMVLVVPIYEVEMTGVFFNTAAVFDADGSYLGKYRKHHIPHCHPGFWEKFYFTPGNAGYPVFETRYGRIGVYICYDRHFPDELEPRREPIRRARSRAGRDMTFPRAQGECAALPGISRRTARRARRHFEAAQTDRRSECRANPRWRAAKLDHRAHSRCGNSRDDATPSGVDRTGDSRADVEQQNRHAVGSIDAKNDSRLGSDHAVGSRPRPRVLARDSANDGAMNLVQSRDSRVPRQQRAKPAPVLIDSGAIIAHPVRQVHGGERAAAHAALARQKSM